MYAEEVLARSILALRHRVRARGFGAFLGRTAGRHGQSGNSGSASEEPPPTNPPSHVHTLPKIFYVLSNFTRPGVPAVGAAHDTSTRAG